MHKDSAANLEGRAEQGGLDISEAESPAVADHAEQWDSAGEPSMGIRAGKPADNGVSELEQDDGESAIRQRIMRAIGEKAGLAVPEATVEAATDNTQSGQTKPAATVRFWNLMDDEDDLDADDTDAATSNRNSGEAALDRTVHDAGMAGGRSGNAAAGNSDAAGCDAAPEPLGEATRGAAVLEKLRPTPMPFTPPIAPLRHDLRGDPRLVRPAPPDIRNGGAERLLEGLIAECHFLMRELVLPSAMESADPEERRRFLSSAMELAHTGATVAKTVAKLRRGVSPATASRISKEEHIQFSQ